MVGAARLMIGPLDIGRWQRHFCEDSSTAVQVLVVEKRGFAEWLAAQAAPRRTWVRANGLDYFTDGAVLVLPPQQPSSSKPEAIVFFTEHASDLYAFSSLPSKLASQLSPFELVMANGDTLPPTVALSWGLGCYVFTRYKTIIASQSSNTFASLVWPKQNDCDRDFVAATLNATFLARDLINTPTEQMGPSELESVMRLFAQLHDAHFESVVGDDLLVRNYPQIHAVGRACGPGREPRLLDLRWGSASDPLVTLVGKGVCYDTGGLSIKSTDGMLTMKRDMGGAAQVLGLASMVMEAKLPLRLRVLIPAVENAISGDSYRPGDVLVARNGKTTEVGNTDAEGRLILADALVEACSEAPALVVDCATLTGSRTVALGRDIPVLIGNDQAKALAARLQAFSAQEQDQVWQMPLWKSYRRIIDSAIADMINCSASSDAGAITAGLYLNEFIEPPAQSQLGQSKRDLTAPPPWLHIDFSGFHMTSRPGRPEGGDPQGMRALFRLLREEIAGLGGDSSNGQPAKRSRQ
eukprot:TRINITY_DN68469_c0_g1_i1.p1 TRINITY_DN68469_c0_g1~~TRINITY_DN68469_c0_g1_i1.p1  ORF type:complete len:547 (-),score=71.33 TRINITY_DN68469_c0_g1_i1:188-1756(-)